MSTTVAGAVGDDPEYADVLYSDEDKEFHGVKDSKLPIRGGDGQPLKKPAKKAAEEEEDEPDPAGPVKVHRDSLPPQPCRPHPRGGIALRARAALQVRFGRKSDKKKATKATASPAANDRSEDVSEPDMESKQRKGRKSAPEPEL